MAGRLRPPEPQMTTAKKSKKKRISNRPDATGDGLRLQIIVAGVILAILSLAALYLIRGPQIERPVTQSVDQVIDDMAVEIDSLLLRSGLTLDQVDRQREPGLLRYDIRGPLPVTQDLDRLRQRLQLRVHGLSDQRQPESGEVAYYWQGGLVVVLKFEVGEQPLLPVTPPLPTKPQVAIIMDDLGRSVGKARQLIALDLHVTFAILPGEAQATSVAKLALRHGQQVMLHIPMEPHDYPQTNPGSDALLLGQSPDEIRRRLTLMLDKVPKASGANNHMGSRFTEYGEGMAVVLQVLREKKLFFIDSRTTSRSIGGREAVQVGVPVGVRDMFLDNVAEVDAIRGEIRKLIRLAQRQGSAVGICHPYPETLAALGQERDLLRNGSVELVFASTLAH